MGQLCEGLLWFETIARRIFGSVAGYCYKVQVYKYGDSSHFCADEHLT